MRAVVDHADVGLPAEGAYEETRVLAPLPICLVDG